MGGGEAYKISTQPQKKKQTPKHPLQSIIALSLLKLAKFEIFSTVINTMYTVVWNQVKYQSLFFPPEHNTNRNIRVLHNLSIK